MSEDIAIEFIKDLLTLIEEHNNNGNKGYKAIKSEYWFGILVESSDMKRDLMKLLAKYNILID